MTLQLQLVGLLFAVFMMYFTFLHYKRDEFKKYAFFMWMAVWVVFAVLVMVPSILNPLIGALSFNRAMDFFTVVGFIFLVTAVFFNFTVVKKNEKKIEELVRKIALDKKRKH